MIFQDAENCAKVLLSLNADENDILDAKNLWESSDELREAICANSVRMVEKYAVIDKLFPKSLTNFFKVMCEFGHIKDLSDIILAYENLVLNQKNILSAQFYYVNEPDAQTVDKFKQMLKSKYDVSDAVITLVYDESLIGGYKLKVGDTEYDKSIKGSIKALQNALIWR